MLWPRAAKKSENWHRGIVDAADRFMKRWHRGEAEKTWRRLTTKDTKSSNQGKSGGRGGGGAAVLVQLRSCMYEHECRNEVADRVARYQFD